VVGSGFAERADDARLDPRAAVRENNRPKDRRTVPSDERAEAPIEKRSADGLDVGEVKADAPGVFQRLGDLVVDLLRVDTRPHPMAIIVHLNDLHQGASHGRLSIRRIALRRFFRAAACFRLRLTDGFSYATRRFISWSKPSFSTCFFKALKAGSIWLSTTMIFVAVDF
jgi:hypothetical protein